MGKILNFFKRDRRDQTPAVTFDELLDRVRPYSQPALRLSKATVAAKSYIGGHAAMIGNEIWPNKDGKRLAFLANLSLDEIAETQIVPWLPTTGHLLFFYDIENQPWGFDPKDRGGWAVLYTESAPAEGASDVNGLRKFPVRFERFESVPSLERLSSLGVELSDSESDTFIDGVYLMNNQDFDHRVSGFPDPVQGDEMELECQLASNGIFVGDSGGYENDEAKALVSGAKDWRLLLQFSSDDDLELMWGDCGSIYFWVREQDARRGDFSNVWLVLQCA